MPASMSFSSISTLCEAGPIVQRIFVLLNPFGVIMGFLAVMVKGT
jgi:hypothetical protein